MMKQASASELLENQIIELSFKSSEDQYPSISNNPNNAVIYQSLIRDDNVRRPQGVKRSSFNLEDSFDDKSMKGLSESFSALNGSIREESAFKSKLKTNRSELKESDYPSEKELWEFNQSIFTDRVGNQVVGLNRRSSDKDKYKEEQPQSNYQPFEMKSTLSANPQPKLPSKSVKVAVQSEIKVILRSTNYFLQKSSGDSVMVNGEMLRDLYDEFFKKELFVPLFKYDRFDEWNHAKDKFNPDLEAHRIFRVSLDRYVRYISNKYPKEFEQVFKILQEIQRGKVAKKREQSAFTFLNFDIASLMESLKNYISSPKTEILRKTLLTKIRAIQQTLKMATEKPQLKQYEQKMKERVEQLWGQFGEIQLLLNFEETQYYCSKKIENSPQLKFRQIWIKYRQFMRQQKTRHSQSSLRSILI